MEGETWRSGGFWGSDVIFTGVVCTAHKRLWTMGIAKILLVYSEITRVATLFSILLSKKNPLLLP
jgi:hypothetical protein